MNKMTRNMKTISCSFILFFSTAFCSVAYSLDSKSADLKLFNKAVQMSTDGDWSGAEKIFRDVAQRNPGWPEPKNNLAIVLYNAGKLEQARQSLDEAVAVCQVLKWRRTIGSGFMITQPPWLIIKLWAFLKSQSYQSLNY